jgi:hypothetical protein
MEYNLREYTMTEELKFKLREKMQTMTGIQLLCNYDYRALDLTDKDGNKFTSVIFNSKYSDPKALAKLYNMVFSVDSDASFIRSRNYIKVRRHYKLDKEETFITLASYIQSSGIIDPLELINRLLLIVESGYEL